VSRGFFVAQIKNGRAELLLAFAEKFGRRSNAVLQIYL
jgi:hypothetical protein